MSRPLIIAHHLIWTLYGWWLPNDPRGSCSRIIRNPSLDALGELHYGRKRIQPASRDIHAFYEQASVLLRHPLISFAPTDFATVADGLGEAMRVAKYTCYACAILPDHVHLLIRKHRDTAEEMIERLQGGSRTRIVEAGVCPSDHPVWVRGGWKVFLDEPDDIRRVIRYIEDNPLPYRLPRQRWEFVTPYDGWPLHEGHSPYSPYARRMRERERSR